MFPDIIYDGEIGQTNDYFFTNKSDAPNYLIVQFNSEQPYPLAFYVANRIAMMPGTRVVVMAHAFRQSKRFFELVLKLVDKSPSFNIETSINGPGAGPIYSADKCSQSFSNGSEIIAIPRISGERLCGNLKIAVPDSIAEKLKSLTNAANDAQILKPGKLPDNLTSESYRGTCNGCGCEVELKRFIREARAAREQHVGCPTEMCHGIIVASLRGA